MELPVLRPQVTLVQDYSLPLERYDDYEDDEGELRAESNLAEKFGKSSMSGSLASLWAASSGRLSRGRQAATDHTVGVH